MKELYHIKPASAADAAQQTLVIETGAGFISFGKIGLAGEMVEAAYFTAVPEEEDLLSVLLHHIPSLNDRYHQIMVGYAFPAALLIPDKLYHFENSDALIRSVYGETGPLTVINEAVPAWQLHTVYTAPGWVRETAARRFANARYWHRYSATLKTKPAGSDQLLVHFDRQEFSVLAFQNNQLLLAQIFSYTAPEDVLYALLKITHSFQLSQQTVQVLISGLAEENSALYKELYRYFIRIDWAVHTGDHTLADHFNEYPPHYFTSLFNLAACAS